MPRRNYFYAVYKPATGEASIHTTWASASKCALSNGHVNHKKFYDLRGAVEFLKISGARSCYLVNGDGSHSQGLNGLFFNDKTC